DPAVLGRAPAVQDAERGGHHLARAETARPQRLDSRPGRHCGPRREVVARPLSPPGGWPAGRASTGTKNASPGNKTAPLNTYMLNTRIRRTVRNATSGVSVTEPDTTLLVRALGTHTPHTSESVRAVTARLIREGAFAPGARLPTIRELSQRCGLSTRTLVAAWSELRKEGLITTNRRGGTVVAAPADVPLTRVLADRDLLTGSPDYALQPDLAAAMLAGLHTDQLNRPAREYITDRLRDAVVDSWPFEAQSFVAAGGGSEGLLLAVDAAAPPGALVA